MPANNSNDDILDKLIDKLDLMNSQLSLLNKLLLLNMGTTNYMDKKKNVDLSKLLEILYIDCIKKDHIVDLTKSIKHPLLLTGLEKSEIYQTLRDKGFTDKNISEIFDISESSIRSSISQKKKK